MAVLYIANAHATLPAGTDVVWFRSMLDFAVELAVPNSELTESARMFLTDVQKASGQSGTN